MLASLQSWRRHLIICTEPPLSGLVGRPSSKHPGCCLALPSSAFPHLPVGPYRPFGDDHSAVDSPMPLVPVLLPPQVCMSQAWPQSSTQSRSLQHIEAYSRQRASRWQMQIAFMAACTRAFFIRVLPTAGPRWQHEWAMSRMFRLLHLWSCLLSDKLRPSLGHLDYAWPKQQQQRHGSLLSKSDS